MSKTFFSSLLSFIRLPNLFIIVAMMWAVRWFLFQPFFSQFDLVFTLSSVQFNVFVFDVLIVTVFGYVINDWQDREIDRINRPQRFLVKYQIPKRIIFSLLSVLALIGLILTLGLAFQTENLRHVWIFGAAIGLLWFYAKRFKSKGFLGNLTVSLLIAALPVLVVLAEWPGFEKAQALRPEAVRWFFTVLFMYALLMFLSNLSRELAKDAQDAEGDKSHEVSSVPIKFGFATTNKAILILMMLVAGCEIALIFLVRISPWFCGFMIVVTSLAVFISIRVSTAQFPNDYKRVSSWLKLLMVIGILQLIGFHI